MSDFEYDFDGPDSNASSPVARNQGRVKPTMEGESAGYLDFGLGLTDDIIQLIDMETYEGFSGGGAPRG